MNTQSISEEGFATSDRGNCMAYGKGDAVPRRQTLPPIGPADGSDEAAEYGRGSAGGDDGGGGEARNGFGT